MIAPPRRVFLDTNILLYTISRDPRAVRAVEALAEGHAISVQVLNEFANTARRKMALSLPEIRNTLVRFRQLYDVLPLTLATHERALDVAGRYGFSIYDALILAAAGEAECDALYSEDLQHGQVVDGVRVINPFLGTA